jgi:hypothetical protein
MSFMIIIGLDAPNGINVAVLNMQQAYFKLKKEGVDNDLQHNT